MVCGCSLIVDGKMSAAVVPMVLSGMKLTPKMMMLLLILSCRPHVLRFAFRAWFLPAPKYYKINGSIFRKMYIFSGFR